MAELGGRILDRDRNGSVVDDSLACDGCGSTEITLDLRHAEKRCRSCGLAGERGVKTGSSGGKMFRQTDRERYVGEYGGEIISYLGSPGSRATFGEIHQAVGGPHMDVLRAVGGLKSEGILERKSPAGGRPAYTLRDEHNPNLGEDGNAGGGEEVPYREGSYREAVYRALRGNGGLGFSEIMERVAEMNGDAGEQSVRGALYGVMEDHPVETEPADNPSPSGDQVLYVMGE